MATKQTSARPAREVTVAPEVAARILEQRGNGESLSAIGRTLHLTPGELAGVLRAAGRTVPVEVAP